MKTAQTSFNFVNNQLSSITLDTHDETGRLTGMYDIRSGRALEAAAQFLFIIANEMMTCENLAKETSKLEVLTP